MIIETVPELLIESGLPGSGKTTRAREWVAAAPNRTRVNYDELRLEMFGPDWRFNRKDENAMKDKAEWLAITALKEGRSVVIDNTNLSLSAKTHWREVGKSVGATVVEEEIVTPIAECVRRDRLRQGKARVGQAVIDRMALFYGFIDWNDKSVYHRAATGKDFIVVDVDGTLADCEHRRHYVQPAHKMDCTFAGVTLPTGPKGNCKQCDVSLKKDWGRFFRECDKDTAIRPIFKLVQHLAKSYYVLVVSGRPMDSCGKATEDWLLQYGLDPLHLFMRDNGDNQDDTIVKREIAELLPLERVAYVIDDRPRVLRMWRELGLTTLAVGDLKEF